MSAGILMNEWPRSADAPAAEQPAQEPAQTTPCFMQSGGPCDGATGQHVACAVMGEVNAKHTKIIALRQFAQTNVLRFAREFRDAPNAANKAAMEAALEEYRARQNA